MFLCASDGFEQWIRGRTGGPNESICVNRGSVAQSNRSTGKLFNFCIQANLHLTPGEFSLGVNAQSFAQFREDDWAGMNQDDSQQVFR